MASSIAWLDSSREDQLKMREMLNLFAETESRDELGIGQVRDAFSDSLFPGTSTLLTRARYFLIIPWCFRDAEMRGLSGAALARRVERNERTILVTLKEAGETEGLIGRRRGPDVKTLPSTLYRSSLGHYGIRTSSASDESLAHRVVSHHGAESEEVVDRIPSPWNKTLPPVPEGFPKTLEGGLSLQFDEAVWLRERIIETVEGSLLAHLLVAGNRPNLECAAPWLDEAALEGASDDVLQVLKQAKLFSLVMHGAALLYNLLIAERYEEAGFDKVVGPTDSYRTSLGEWFAEVSVTPALATWHRIEMWSHVTSVNPRIAGNAGVRSFVDAWIDGVVDATTAPGVVDSPSLRSLVALREQSVKRAQSRLINDKLLREWNGGSGTGRLVYRWNQVSKIVDDIHTGMELRHAAS